MKNRLCKQYKDFVAHQTQCSASTRLGLTRMLGSWNHRSLRDLTPEWFRERLARLSPNTMHKELVYIRMIMKHFGKDLEPWSKDRMKVKKPGETVTAEDLYTKEGLAAIFRACNHTRDRALFEVLYESGVRASELLTMTFNRVQFNDDSTAHVIVDGKTGTRNILLHASVPALKTWMNLHPYGKGPIWVTIRTRGGKYVPIRYGSLYALASRIIRELDLKRDHDPKRLLHMFRHTRATELVRLGVRGQSLSKFMGWSKKSNMEATYVHLTGEDVDNDLRSKVFGMDVEQERAMPILQIIKCLKCGTPNDPHGNICSNCGAPTSKEALAELIQKDQAQTDIRQELEYLKERLAVLDEFESWMRKIERTIEVDEMKAQEEEQAEIEKILPKGFRKVPKKKKK